jgi:hypothetical protein
LAHWSPVMAEAEFLPGFVFPFIKAFENNPLQAFEIIVTALLNWGQQWFEFFPHPPVNVRSLVLGHAHTNMTLRFSTWWRVACCTLTPSSTGICWRWK